MHRRRKSNQADAGFGCVFLEFIHMSCLPLDGCCDGGLYFVGCTVAGSVSGSGGCADFAGQVAAEISKLLCVLTYMQKNMKILYLLHYSALSTKKTFILFVDVNRIITFDSQKYVLPLYS